MFRCTKELNGLAIDYDSFNDVMLNEWKKINSIINCIFITSSPKNVKILSNNFDETKVLYLDIFEKNFSPNIKTHGKVLEKLNLETNEIAYVSSSYSFIKYACNFLSATIWVSNMVDYDKAKNLPDLVVGSMDRLIDALEKNVAGFFGEIVMFPEEHRLGSVLHISFDVDGDELPMHVVGRYFGHDHYMNQLHPYSRAIYLNKRAGRSYTNVFNSTFGNIYAAVISLLGKKQIIDGVCSVPVKPDRENRFAEPLDIICSDCNIENLSSKFSCIKVYSEQKGLNSEEREKNINGVFQYAGDLTGKTVVLIDDIVTTGATLRECVRVLRGAGAKEVAIVVMAINQMEASYWNTELPKVSCPLCRARMMLFVAGQGNKRGEFFYSCMNCYHDKQPSPSLDFSVGWETFLTEENRKFTEARNEDIRDEWLDDEWLDDSDSLIQ